MCENRHSKVFDNVWGKASRTDGNERETPENEPISRKENGSSLTFIRLCGEVEWKDPNNEMPIKAIFNFISEYGRRKGEKV